MTDPISGAMASQAAQMIQESAATEGAQPSGKSFAEVLQQGPPQVEQTPEVTPVEAPEQVAEPAALDAYIEGILGDESRISELLESSMRGDALGPQEMLQMQALIYSYSQKVELTTKVVEKATGGIKQVMNTQV